jgi:hypothetical protein
MNTLPLSLPSREGVIKRKEPLIFLSSRRE